MPKATIASYLQWITPRLGDPTHSILRAHLLFEMLFDDYLARVLPHPKALEGSRFSFAQKLAIVQAVSPDMESTDWKWLAIRRLNKVRNMLAHSPGPEISAALSEYVAFCLNHNGVPLPPLQSVESDGVPNSIADTGAMFGAHDLVTVGLYSALAVHLRYDTDAFFESH